MRLDRSALFACLLVLALAAPAVAAPATGKPVPPAAPGEAYGPGGRAFSALPQEKRDAFFTIMGEFRDKTQPIREQLWAKKAILRALSGNPKTEPQQIESLVNDMSALRQQLYTERKAVAERVRKEVGIDAPFLAGFGPHNGMGGMGCGMGYGGGPRGFHYRDGRGYGHGQGYGHGYGPNW